MSFSRGSGAITCYSDATNLVSVQVDPLASALECCCWLSQMFHVLSCRAPQNGQNLKSGRVTCARWTSSCCVASKAPSRRIVEILALPPPQIHRPTGRLPSTANSSIVGASILPSSLSAQGFCLLSTELSPSLLHITEAGVYIAGAREGEGGGCSS